MNTALPQSYTTQLPQISILRLGLDAARRAYAEADNNAAEAWRLYEEAIDDGDREAIADLGRMAEVLEMQKADAYQEREAAYASLSAALN